MIQAEQLLNWVNVKSRASQSKDPEIVRMMDQVIHALADGELTFSISGRSLCVRVRVRMHAHQYTSFDAHYY